MHRACMSLANPSIHFEPYAQKQLPVTQLNHAYKKLHPVTLNHAYTPHKRNSLLVQLFEN